MANPSFSECVTNTAAKLRLFAGRCQKLASQIEKLETFELPSEVEQRAVVYFGGLGSSLADLGALDEAIELLQQINEAVK